MKKKHQHTNMTQIVSLIIGMIAVITTRNLELFALDQQITTKRDHNTSLFRFQILALLIG